MNTRIFADDYIVKAGNATPETGWVGITSFPASGSFIDTRGHDLVHILIHVGGLTAADNTVEPKVSDANNGTLDQLDAALVHTIAADDDGEFITYTLETRKFPEGHPFIALAIGGTLASTYGDVVFVLPGRSLPVAQTELPAASQYSYVG